MKDHKALNPIELSHAINSKNFTLALYFIQVLVYLCDENILKIQDQETPIIHNNQLYKKSLFVCISKNFFSYKSDKYTKDFTAPFSAKHQQIRLIEFIHLAIATQLPDKNWKTIFDRKEKFQQTDKLSFITSESKYFDYIKILDSNAKLDLTTVSKHKDLLFIKKLSITNFRIFDFIFEETKNYISKKNRDSKDWHWGKGNASPAF